MKISVMYIFSFKQKFKNTNIAPEFPQSHSWRLKLYKMHFVQWNDSRPLVIEYMEDKLSLFFLSFLFYERNGNSVRLGWAIFEKICLFFSFQCCSLSPHLSPQEGWLCIICYQGRPCCSKGTWCVRNTCWMPWLGSEFQLLHSLCLRQRECSAPDNTWSF